MTSALGNLGLDPDDINNVAVEIKNGKRIGKVCREIPSRIGMRGYLNNIVSDLFEDGEKVQKIWEVRFKFLTQKTCLIIYILLKYSENQGNQRRHCRT